MFAQRSFVLGVLVAALLLPAASRGQEAPPQQPPQPTAGMPTKSAVLPDGARVVSTDGRPNMNTAPVRQPLPPIADAEIKRVVETIGGSWKTQAVGGTPALLLNLARVDIRGVDNALYFEIVRADTPHVPFRQGLFIFWKKEGYLRLRVLDLASKTLADSVVGLWTRPSLFPELATDQLIPNLDVQLKPQGDGWVSEASGRVPTTKIGAWELETSVGFSAKAISFNDRGLDMAGNQVFGTPDGKPLVFSPCEPNIKAREMEGGLIVIDLVPPAPDLPKAEDNTLMAIHYSGWLTDGTCFGTSRGKEAQQVQLPANFIAGFNMGLPGIAKGSVRRLWIPSGLAFGPLGNAGFKIPPDSPIIFEVECRFLEKLPPPPPPAPTPPASGTPADGPVAPPPANQPPNQ